MEALSDGLEPEGSGDQGIPRFTWWDHHGTREWVQFEFGNTKKVSGVSVYWFDDTGVGRCRVPPRGGCSIARETGEGGGHAKADAIAKDRFNRMTFVAVESTGLRLEVQLKPDFSGGILEWKVE